MSEPKFVTKKYDPAKAPSSYPRIHPKTLTATSSRRIVDLALPKKPLVLSTLRYTTNKTLIMRLTDLLHRLRTSRYQRYRIFCNAYLERSTARERRIRQKLRRALVTEEDWARHNEILNRIAVPKEVPRPRAIARRKKWRPVNMRRMNALAQPASREIPEVRDPFTVPPSALTYVITGRIRKIAEPKYTPADFTPPKVPGAVAPAALTAKASARTEILAKPLERPMGTQSDVRLDAFTVSPKALKARCPKRIKILAQPKTYGKSRR